MECIKCGAELADSEVECPSCGVILSKAQAPPPPRDPSTAAGGSAGSRSRQQYYHYFVVPFHGNLRAGQEVEEVSSQLQALINHYAAHGWEFVQVGSVSLTVNQGCLGALVGRSTSQHSYDQVIFRRAV